MERVAQKQLDNLADTINQVTHSPRETRVGHYAVEPGSSTYGYHWKLVRISNMDGGYRIILTAPTARELQAVMWAWLEGYRTAKETGK